MAEREFRVLLADDHPVVATGFRLAISQAPGLSVCGTALSPDSLSKMAAVDPPDAFVLDLVFGGQLQIDLVEECRRQFPEAVIIVFTSLPARTYRQTALSAGANAFVGKDSDLEALVGVLLDHLTGPRRGAITVSSVPTIPNIAEIAAEFTSRGGNRKWASCSATATPSTISPRCWASA